MDHREQAADRVLRLAARDPFARSLGIECVGAGPGRSVATLTIADRHLNFNGACHGGVIFALADTAFGLASNSHGMIAVGIDAHVTYNVAVLRGDVLSATATEISRARRIAVYRIDVANGEGVLVAAFTGTVYVTTRPHDAATPRH